jgi:thioredoxin 1
MSNAVHITDATFGPVVEEGPGLYVIDFWAPWCAPCRALAPVRDQLARQYAGRAKVAKLNVHENPETAARFGVRSIPTLLFFRDGRACDRVTGLVPRGELAARIDHHLDSASAAA